MKNVKLSCLLLFILFFNSLFSQTDPNIVLIIVDDMGWSQVSTGSTNLNNPSDFYETPNIETLASEGIAFPYGYVNGANCAPTRAAILSGQFGARSTNNVFNVHNLNRGNNSTNSTLIGPDVGLATNGQDQIPSTAITIAETLKTAGYTTAHWGKYHSGEDEATNFSNNAPTDQGFDYNYGGGQAGGPGNYFASLNAPYTFGSNIDSNMDVYAAPYTLAESLALSVNGDDALEGTPKHVTDALADAAIDFMEAEKNTPFFMHFSNFAIHGPTGQSHARPDLYAKYVAKNNTNPSSMGHNNLGIAAILEGMDQTIGRLIDYLKTTPDPRNPGNMLSENTLVYLISDNGGAINTQENGPLKGMKGEYTEGGIRSVTFAWSEASWLANKGTVNTTPIQAFDLYPTFVEAAGGTLPSGYDIDGASQWQMLTNGTAMTREALYWHFPGYLIDSKRDSRPTSIARKGDYKLRYNYETLSYQLYDVVNDISENTNLLAGSPDQETLIIANDMSALLRNHLIDTNAPLPTYLSDGATCPLPFIIDTTPSGGGGGLCEATAGFEAYWNFDIANGANDASGNGHDPNSINGTLTYDVIDFKEGDQSVIFDGTVNIRYSSGSFMTAATSSRSVVAWIKPVALAGIQNILDEGGNLAGIGMRLNGSTLESIVKQSSVNFSLISSSAPIPNDGNWHHVALVYDGSNTNHKLYIDGVEVANNNSAPSSIPSHTGLGGIAGKISGTDSFGNSSNVNFIGKMDGYALYNNALTLAEVEEAACLNEIIADAGPDVTICEGDSTTLSASGGDTYLWNTGATTASINVSPTSTSIYSVIVSSNGYSNSDDTTVTVNSAPNADAGSDVTIINGDTTTLTATGNGTYLWSTGDTTVSINVNPSSTTVYSVTVTNNGCSATDSVTVTVETGACTYSLINSEGFESGWGIWNDGGSDSRRSSRDTAYANSGTYCIRLRDNTSTSVATTDNLDLTFYEEITIDFAYYARSMDNSSEDFWLQISTNGGGNYTTVEEWNRDDEFLNNQFKADQVIIPGPFTSNTRLRFRCDASGNQDWVYIDDVVINGCSTSGGSRIVAKKPVSISKEENPISDKLITVLYPNPFEKEINIRIEEGYDQANVEVFNTIGQQLITRAFKESAPIKIMMENFESGQYFIRIQVDGEIITKLAVKK